MKRVMGHLVLDSEEKREIGERINRLLSSRGSAKRVELKMGVPNKVNSLVDFELEIVQHLVPCIPETTTKRRKRR